MATDPASVASVSERVRERGERKRRKKKKRRKRWAGREFKCSSPK